MKNIFQLYREDERVPFIVRRKSWSWPFGLLVTRVEPQGTYGSAFGHGLPPLNGEEPNPYWGTPGQENRISCDGCYQWERVEPVPEAWEAFLTD